jgi:hypothetical protein
MKAFYIILLFFVFSCSKKDYDQKQAILSLKEMSELATVEYTVTKIIKANDNKTWYKIGDRKILMSCEATIKAGVDLSSINENSFDIDGKNVQLKLPPPKIISFSIPPDKIKVEYQEIGPLREPFKTGERDKLATQAEAQIKNNINSLGIIEQAKANTSLLVSNMLKQMGYENVTIVYSGDQPEKKMQ